MSLLLDKNIVSDSDLSDRSILAYIALRRVMNEQMHIVDRDRIEDCISCNRLCYMLDRKFNPYYLDAIYAGIHELALRGLVTIKQDLSTTKSHEYIIDMEKIYLDAQNDLYIIVQEWEIEKILSCEEIRSEKRISVLRYFLILIGTFNNSSSFGYGPTKIGHMPISYIAGQASVSERTAIRYNRILSVLKLIYIYKTNDKLLVDGKLKQIKNAYSRYCDKELCISFGKNGEQCGYISQVVVPRKNKEQSDHNRSLGQKYNAMLRWYLFGQKCRYEKPVVEEIYRYISGCNRELEQLIEDRIRQSDTAGKIPDSEKEYIDRMRSRIRREDFLVEILKGMESEK